VRFLCGGGKFTSAAGHRIATNPFGLAWIEERSVPADPGELRQPMGDKPAVGENVANGKAVRQQPVGQQPAMAPPPQCLGAEQAAPRCGCNGPQLCEGRCKLLAEGVVGVAAEGRLAPATVWGVRVGLAPAAKAWKVEVSDPGVAKEPLEPLFGELRVSGRGRYQPHIDHHLHPSALKEG